MGLFSRKPDQDEGLREAAPRARRKAADSRAQTDPDSLHDPAANLKRRARQRLIGAIALVVGAVVILPWFFDAEPKNSVDDLIVQIPDKDSAFNARLPDTPSAPSVSKLVPGAIAAPPAPSGSAVVPSPAVNVQTSNVQPSSTTAVVQAKSDEHPVAASAAKNPDKPASAYPHAATKADDPRAIAAFEGKSLPAGATSPAASSAASAAPAGHFEIQVGAYANADKAREVKSRFDGSGLHAYTELIKTPLGERTRLRVGPLASKEAAEKARDRIRGMGLDATIIAP